MSLALPGENRATLGDKVLRDRAVEDPHFPDPVQPHLLVGLLVEDVG